MTLKCWSSSQVEKRFWSWMPILKKITSPALKKKKKPKVQNNILKKKRPKAQNNLGLKIKIKHKASPMNKWSKQGQEPNYGQLGRQGTKKYWKTTKRTSITETLNNDWIQAVDIIQIQGSRKPIHSSNAKFNHMIHISSPAIADATDRLANFDGEVAARKEKAKYEKWYIHNFFTTYSK